jgi:hypothetical protein
VIDFNKLRAFLYRLEGNYDVSTLTIGGGEPALVIPELYQLLEEFRWQNVYYDNIYVVTNGTYRTLSLAEWFYEAYNRALDNEVSSFGFSFDHYHRDAIYGRGLTDKRMQKYYEVEDYFSMRISREILRKHTKEEYYAVSIIKMGRAENWGARDLEPYPIDEKNQELLYYTTDGNIFSSCDLSYKEMAKKEKSRFYVGNYLDNLQDKIAEYNERVRKKEDAVVKDTTY